MLLQVSRARARARARTGARRTCAVCARRARRRRRAGYARHARLARRAGSCRSDNAPQPKITAAAALSGTFTRYRVGWAGYERRGYICLHGTAQHTAEDVRAATMLEHLHVSVGTPTPKRCVQCLHTIMAAPPGRGPWYAHLRSDGRIPLVLLMDLVVDTLVMHMRRTVCAWHRSNRLASNRNPSTMLAGQGPDRVICAPCLGSTRQDSPIACIMILL